MCRLEESGEERSYRYSKLSRMRLVVLAESKVQNFKNCVTSKSQTRMWIIRAVTTALIWTYVIHLVAFGETWGPRLLKGWPSACFNHPEAGEELSKLVQESSSQQIKVLLPPKSK